jgi:hypothetical protein
VEKALIEKYKNATRTTTYIYGSYMRYIPPLPVGVRKGNTKITAADANDVDGSIRANKFAGEKDDKDKLYSDYWSLVVLEVSSETRTITVDPNAGEATIE